MITSLLSILFLAFAQNVSFTIVSRSRNRSSFAYHMIAAVFSNSIFFLTFRELILAEMSWLLFIPYLIGTVAGSLTGAKVSMWIEKKVDARSDDHLGPQWSPPQFSSPMAKVEATPTFPSPAGSKIKVTTMTSEIKKPKLTAFICKACKQATKKGQTHPGVNHMHMAGICDCPCRSE